MQKAAKEAKRIRTVFPPNVILASVKKEDDLDEEFARDPFKNFRVTKETL
jgi:hypothetical protein